MISNIGIGLGVALILKSDRPYDPRHVKQIESRITCCFFQLKFIALSSFAVAPFMFAALSVLDLLELLLTLVLPLKIIGSDGEPEQICRVTAVREWLEGVLFGDQ